MTFISFDSTFVMSKIKLICKWIITNPDKAIRIFSLMFWILLLIIIGGYGISRIVCINALDSKKESEVYECQVAETFRKIGIYYLKVVLIIISIIAILLLVFFIVYGIYKLINLSKKRRNPVPVELIEVTA